MTIPLEAKRASLNGEKLFKGYLGYYSHSIPERIKRKCYCTSFDIKTLSGLYIHSQISQHPRSNFYTDGVNIWYYGSPQTKMKDEDVKSALSEYVISGIISLSPQQENIYDNVNGHLRIANFQNSFSEEKNEYHAKMENLAQSNEQLINYEKHEIKVIRMRRNGLLVDKFIQACQQDEKTQKIAEILNKNLLQYREK